MVKLLTHCCCSSCSLRRGTLAIGIFFLIDDILAVLGLAFLISDFDGGMMDQIIAKDYFLLTRSSGKEFLITLLIYYVLHVIFNSLLIHCVKKNINRFIITWVVFYSIALCLGVIYFLIDFFFKIGKGLEGAQWAEPLSRLFGIVVGILVQGYLILVVYSYYRSVKDGTERQDNVAYTGVPNA